MVAAMAIRNRIEVLERETRFQDWLRFQRYLEALSVEQLEAFVVLGFIPDPAPSELPPGMSRLDSLPRKELTRLFNADERKRARFDRRSNEEKLFFIDHAHWPEVTCEQSDCQKAWMDIRTHHSRTTGSEQANVAQISTLRQNTGGKEAQGSLRPRGMSALRPSKP
jgi:hypothetical protein